MDALFNANTKEVVNALTEDLYFNVSWLFNKFLNKQRSVAESRQGFRVGPLVILLKFLTDEKKNPYMSALERLFRSKIFTAKNAHRLYFNVISSVHQVRFS